MKSLKLFNQAITKGLNNYIHPRTSLISSTTIKIDGKKSPENNNLTEEIVS